MRKYTREVHNDDINNNMLFFKLKTITYACTKHQTNNTLVHGLTVDIYRLFFNEVSCEKFAKQKTEYDK